MAEKPKTIHKAAVLLFDEVDLLDFAGPTEVFIHLFRDNDLQKREPVFQAVVVGSQPTIRVNQALTVTTDLNMEEAVLQISDFEVLVVPGGPPRILQAMIDRKDPALQFITKFMHQKPRSDGNQRFVLSVCSGALLLAAEGAMMGVKATSHHMVLDNLRQLEPTAQVISHVNEASVGRYVDGGTSAEGVRVITAGGVTCGLDASLHVGELFAGKDVAEFTAKFLEHEWKRA